MNQKQRFEAEFFRQNAVHIHELNYRDPQLARNFAWFCLGEASGKDIAAQCCEENGRNDGITCAEEIRNGCTGRADRAGDEMNGTLCRTCGQDHQTMTDAYRCSKREMVNHPNNCTCCDCYAVRAYESAQEPKHE